MKLQRLSREGSLISSWKSRFGSRCSGPRSRGPVVSINKLLVIELRRPNYFLEVQTVRLRDQGQCHVLFLEVKFVYDLILVQGPDFKFRAGAPSKRTNQVIKILMLEEPSISQSLEETQLVIIVQLNILSRKIRQPSAGQIVLHLIHNLKVRSTNNKN